MHLNNFLGNTMTKGHADFNTSVGSLGEEQLNWLEAELGQRKPTFVFVHFPLYIVKPLEQRAVPVPRIAGEVVRSSALAADDH